jgi:hypothetical protein
MDDGHRADRRGESAGRQNATELALADIDNIAAVQDVGFEFWQ